MWYHQAITVVLTLVLGCALPCVAQTSKPAARPPDLGTLIKAAQAEKSLTWYMSTGEAVAIRVRDAFKAKYGVDVAFIRLSGATIAQRFLSEAEAGKIVADVLVGTIFSNELANTMIQKGWAESISEAGLPVLGSDFPAAQNTGPTRILGTAPWQIAYNTERVKTEELPKDWKELFNPRWKGRIVVPDPRSSPDTYLPIWELYFSRYGEAFFKSLREQNFRLYAGSSPMIQALAAGEGDIAIPILAFNVLPLAASGAPLGVASPKGGTTGNESRIVLTHRGKSPHPNAAKLFVNYLLSKDGNAVFNADPGQVGPYSQNELPEDFQAFVPRGSETVQQRGEKIYKLLGLVQ